MFNIIVKQSSTTTEVHKITNKQWWNADVQCSHN